MVREILLAVSKNGSSVSKRREHTNARALREPEVSSRTNADAALIPPASQRVTSSQGHSACWIATVLTNERTRMFGLVARFLSKLRLGLCFE